VVATTGHDERETELIKRASEHIPVFFSANMSLGVALLCELAKTAAKTMPDADIEIIEKHHNRKLDAPSGTALLLADAISTVRKGAYYVFGRGGQRKREKAEIGIHAIRMGNIVGEHEVIIGTDTQTITLKHEAHTRALFAEGAIAAADFLTSKPAGLYCMRDIVK
jgi:4-hydroxy-tetrahydrodipicolinate reductase